MVMLLCCRNDISWPGRKGRSQILFDWANLKYLSPTFQEGRDRSKLAVYIDRNATVEISCLQIASADIEYCVSTVWEEWEHEIIHARDRRQSRNQGNAWGRYRYTGEQVKIVTRGYTCQSSRRK